MHSCISRPSNAREWTRCGKISNFGRARAGRRGKMAASISRCERCRGARLRRISSDWIGDREKSFSLPLLARASCRLGCDSRSQPGPLLRSEALWFELARRDEDLQTAKQSPSLEFGVLASPRAEVCARARVAQTVNLRNSRRWRQFTNAPGSRPRLPWFSEPDCLLRDPRHCGMRAAKVTGCGQPQANPPGSSDVNYCERGITTRPRGWGRPDHCA